MEISLTPPEQKSSVDLFQAIFKKEMVALDTFVKNIPREQITRVLDVLLSCRGKIIIIGVGKSGLIGRKISATLSSTGSPSFYLSASECAHGDMGAIGAHDVVWLISNSGKTSEILALLPYLEKLKIPVVTLIGSAGSSLEAISDNNIVLPVLREADRLGVVPSSSTTVMLAVGDAIALSLLELKKITKHQFAQWHPGGWLGKQLATHVKHLMHGVDRCPLVDVDKSLKSLLPQMTQIHLGVLVAEVSPKTYGIFTDGDLRRALQSNQDFLNQTLRKVISTLPMTINMDAPAQEALSLMESKKITQLVVLDPKGVYAGVVHIHDLFEFQD
jgi:arabinose-5-phosphate isomerase